ncbi:copper transport protein ATOX1 [Periplaneta americana]|uniref:copper transport protein ATOX1 n=1 Tax=Periplaneta americana TaxID=6978 RepID=UPI0037E72AB6
MAAQVHEFKVEMTCGGCSSAVEKVLGKLKGQGVDKVDISLENQSVLVTSTLSADQLLEIIKKTGKTTSYIIQNLG